TYNNLNDQQFVDRLIANTGETLTTGERENLIASLGNGQDTRAGVLLKMLDGTSIAQNGTIEFTNNHAGSFYQRESNSAFVLMQYFGYLKRDPDAVGFQFWLDKLNRYNNFTDAEMVRSFIISDEYRQRFGVR
ncbi:MAG TPA: DUF4214 domain-containing protein, partial [Pyrinomonadaceae bacterium]|nr:DUF4214 domain-containing protein [Pyrinomonadaceae bacterium]